MPQFGQRRGGSQASPRAARARRRQAGPGRGPGRCRARQWFRGASCLWGLVAGLRCSAPDRLLGGFGTRFMSAGLRDVRRGRS